MADYLLDVASEPKTTAIATAIQGPDGKGLRRRGDEKTSEKVVADEEDSKEKLVVGSSKEIDPRGIQGKGGKYATTFLTQFEVLAGREWKNLRRCLYIAFGLLS